jgi:hypothetical protein
MVGATVIMAGITATMGGKVTMGIAAGTVITAATVDELKPRFSPILPRHKNQPLEEMDVLLVLQ